jgi:hypothetical protein
MRTVKIKEPAKENNNNKDSPVPERPTSAVPRDREALTNSSSSSNSSSGNITNSTPRVITSSDASSPRPYDFIKKHVL